MNSLRPLIGLRPSKMIPSNAARRRGSHARAQGGAPWLSRVRWFRGRTWLGLDHRPVTVLGRCGCGELGLLAFALATEPGLRDNRHKEDTMVTDKNRKICCRVAHHHPRNMIAMATASRTPCWKAAFPPRGQRIQTRAMVATALSRLHFDEDAERAPRQRNTAATPSRPSPVLVNGGTPLPAARFVEEQSTSFVGREHSGRHPLRGRARPEIGGEVLPAVCRPAVVFQMIR
jgi:hypothetical protein